MYILHQNVILSESFFAYLPFITGNSGVVDIDGDFGPAAKAGFPEQP
jgi:hypothetical protein